MYIDIFPRCGSCNHQLGDGQLGSGAVLVSTGSCRGQLGSKFVAALVLDLVRAATQRGEAADRTAHRRRLQMSLISFRS